MDYAEELNAALTAAEALWDGMSRAELERALNDLTDDPEELQWDRFALLAYLADCCCPRLRAAFNA